MKKIILSFALFIVSTSSFAKTQGSYVGIDFVNTRLKFYEKTLYTDGTYSYKKPASADNSNPGAGISYKYAFNFNGLFIAPGLIAEYNNANTDGVKYSSIGQSRRMNIKGRFGAKLDIGFDIGNYVSPYITGGYTGIIYRTRNYGNEYSDSYGYKTATTGEFFGGFGFKFDLTNNMAFNLEYNFQKLTAKTSIVNPAVPFSADYKTRFDVMKAGFSYNF